MKPGRTYFIKRVGAGWLPRWEVWFHYHDRRTIYGKDEWPALLNDFAFLSRWTASRVAYALMHAYNDGREEGLGE